MDRFPLSSPADAPARGLAWHLGLALLLAGMVLLGLLAQVSPAFGGTSGTLEVGSSIYYADWSTHIFSVDGNEAYCAEPSKDTPSPGDYALEGIDDIAQAAGLWYGYGGPGFDAGLWPRTFYDGSSMNANEYRVLTHVALVFLRTGSIGDACVNCSPTFTSWCERNVFGYAPDGTVLSTNAICYRIRTEGFKVNGDGASYSDIPKGFSAYSFEPGGDKQAMLTSAYVPHGYVEVTKRSSNPEVSEGNGCYGLAGARYGIYEDAGCNHLAATLVTDERGWARSELIPCGTYYVKEMAAPTGYALSAEVKRAVVPVRKAVGVALGDLPQNNPVGLVLRKLDGETGQASPQGAATLQGAEYRLRFYGASLDSIEEAEGAEPLRTWVLATDSAGELWMDEGHFVSGDDFFRSSTGDICLPLGTLAINEEKPPIGYLAGTETLLCPITGEGDDERVTTFAAPDHPEQVIRGDVALVKVREADQQRLGNVPFLITSLTSGEGHLAVSDENGEVRTSAAFNPHTRNTNANDAALRRDGSVDEGALDPQAGIWFGSSDPDDGHGALIFDRYRIEELPCSANEGLELITLPSITVSREGYEVHVGSLDDQPASSMSLRTTARDDADGDKVAEPGAATVIVDRVEYSGVAVGKPYLMWGSLIQRSTAEPVRDAHGSAVMMQQEFTPEGANGYVELAFPVDTTAYAGEDIVVCEELIDTETGVTVATDYDLDNYEETVHIAAPEEPEPDEAPLAQTGDRILAPAAALAALGMACLGWLLWRRQRQRRAQRQRAQRLLEGLARR